MFIERRARSAERDATVAALRAACIGCDGCTGPCQAILQMIRVPDLVLTNRTGA